MTLTPSFPTTIISLLSRFFQEEQDGFQLLLVPVDQEAAGVVPHVQRPRRARPRLVVGQLAALGGGLEVEAAAPDGPQDGVTRARVPLVRGVLLGDVVDGPTLRHAKHLVASA